MRVHRLAVSAFGPFADRIEVDFDETGRDGLFLLWGPTGAGKTTLLDAVVFALYGTVPGARGEERRLRSDHAGADVRTEVELEVTLGGERLLVQRRPEQQRPKRRGAGVTTEPARLLVQRATDGGWEAVSTRIDEGSEHLRRRVGLSAEQFCQVVLLPQGDFARFLRAEPDDRARLLSTLFDVGRFASVEQWLGAERSAARGRLDAVRTRASTLIARVAQVADAAVPEELAPETVGVAPGARADAWVATVRAGAAAATSAAEARAAEAAAEVAFADAALAAARATDARHARRDRAAAELDRLKDEAASLAPLRAGLEAGRRAEPLRDVLEAAGAAALAAEAAESALHAARSQWTAVGQGADADALTARSLRDEVARLEALAPEVAREDALSREVRDGERTITRLTERCSRHDADLAALPALLAAAEQRATAAAEAVAVLPGLTEAAQRLADRLAAARAVEQQVDRVDGLRSAASTARERWLDARQHWGDVRARRLDGMAAELAAGLTDGSDCPVCGAVEHPRPATATGPLVSRADEEQAREAADAAEVAQAAARQVSDAAERELAVLRATAGPAPVVEQERAHHAAVARRDSVAALAADHEPARADLAALGARRDDCARALAAAREELARVCASVEGGRTLLGELRARLTQARGDDPDIATRMRRLSTAAQRCEALVEAQAAELRARTAARQTREAAQARAVEAGFADLLEAAATLRERGELATVARRVEDHDAAVTAVTAVLAEPELADLGPRPDLDALVGRCRAATATREAAVADLAKARRCCAALDDLAADLTAVEVELGERRAEAEQLTALADLVSGRGANTLRMRLQSFVLAARLEQVAEVASVRLQDMSGGRYTFLHSDAQGRHGARSGLGLDVLDEYTGTRRPTKTLSGGESFMASLALALGLADVVTAESGGVVLDTLFVDEGFGTLDPQALDAVMDVLDELRRGGRTVGVISHVEELRTRIPSRLEVVSGREGSRVVA